MYALQVEPVAQVVRLVVVEHSNLLKHCQDPYPLEYAYLVVVAVGLVVVLVAVVEPTCPEHLQSLGPIARYPQVVQLAVVSLVGLVRIARGAVGAVRGRQECSVPSLRSGRIGKQGGKGTSRYGKQISHHP